MTNQYAVALPLNDFFKLQIEQLHLSTADQHASLPEQAGKLMSEITCHIIDYIFTDMVKKFSEAKDVAVEKLLSFKESLQQIEEIKGIIRKYFSWAVAWFNAKRLKPVISHYYQLIEYCEIDNNTMPCLIYSIPDEMAEKALLSLHELKNMNASNALQAIECLIDVVDVGVTKMLKEPKDLLKFNFIANKTLDGVITMTTALSYKSLRKLGSAMDSQLHQSASNHLQQFIVPVAGSLFNPHEAADTNLG